jgi:hypothetical protein
LFCFYLENCRVVVARVLTVEQPSAALDELRSAGGIMEACFRSIFESDSINSKKEVHSKEFSAYIVITGVRFSRSASFLFLSRKNMVLDRNINDLIYHFIFCSFFFFVKLPENDFYDTIYRS